MNHYLPVTGWLDFPEYAHSVLYVRGVPIRCVRWAERTTW